MPAASANPAKMTVEGRLYIGNLNHRVTKNEVQHTFSKFGNLRDVWIARDPPGFAFIEYENMRDAEEAIRMLDGQEVLGSTIKVEQSRAQGRGGRGGGRGGGRDGGRGGRDGGRGGDRGSRGGRGGPRGGRGDDRGSRGGRPSYGRDSYGGPSEYGGRGGYRDEPRSRYADPYADPYATAYRSRSPLRRRTPPSAAPPRGGRDYASRDYPARDSYASRDAYASRDYGARDAYASRDSYASRDAYGAPPPSSSYGSRAAEYDRGSSGARGGYDRGYESRASTYDRGAYERPAYDSRPQRRSSPPRR